MVVIVHICFFDLFSSTSRQAGVCSQSLFAAEVVTRGKNPCFEVVMNKLYIFDHPKSQP